MTDELPRVSLYGKPGCHLCEVAERLLARLRPRFPHVLDIYDIEADDTLFERYQFAIPVIHIGNADFHAPIRENEIAAALSAACAG